MVKNPRNVVVIGAGTMGGGIAAHLANLGLQVSLLDLTDDVARNSFDRTKKARPPHFYVGETANTVRVGGIETFAQWVREADWVCEAIVEKLDAKRSLFAWLEPLLRNDAYVSTNTSGLEISSLTEGYPESFRRRLIGTHFFNPPRYLKLLELIPTGESDPEVVAGFTEFLEHDCARRVVVARDTPGFIANRYGMWCMFLAIHVAERLGLSIEQVDAITGPFYGRPRSGSFRLNDVVGLDIMQDIATNLTARCPDDPYIETLHLPRSLEFLVDKGWIGEKSGQGYYRREGREMMSLDLQGLGYRMRSEPDLATVTENLKRPLAERLKTAVEARDEVGEFTRAYLVAAIKYADYLKDKISHSVEDFDRVMMWGFGWEAGPFAMADMVGLSSEPNFKDSTYRTFSGSYTPTRTEPEYLTVQDFPVVATHDHFNLRDMGDGVTAVCTTTKLGVFTVGLVRELKAFLEAGSVKRFVLTSEGRSFSAGFDLQFLLKCALEKDHDTLDKELEQLQGLGLVISEIPSVAAVFGHCLGGGFEMATSCSIVVAHPEVQIGLPEAKVGLIPGGGGAVRMRQRNASSAKLLAEVAKCIVLGTIPANADDARRLGYMRRQDVTVYHPDRLWTEAKRLAIDAVATPDTEWGPVGGPVGGMIEQGITELHKAGEITEYDRTIGEQLRHVFVKSATFDEAMAKERAAFEALLSQGLTVARIKHMLETGKPLRN